MGWLIALGVLFLLAWMPLGVSVRYDETGLLLLIVGPLRFRLYPSKEKKKTTETKVQKAESAPQMSGNDNANSAKPDIFPLIGQVLDFLGELRRKLRVNILEMKIVLAGDDPADLAIAYGSACGALAALEPQLTRVLAIRKKNLRIACDFAAEKTSFYFRADITITIARIISLGLGRGLAIVREYMKIMKLKKGGASS